MPTLRLVQLPVPPPAALAATGNVPLAAGCLATAARVHGLDRRLGIDLVQPADTDALGDSRLADLLARDEPEYLGFSLYLWNCERSLYLASEVKRRSPRTRVLVGGPEVGPDNPFVLQQSGFDLAVTGEAEQTFAQLMAALLDGGDPSRVPGVAVRRPLGLSPFAPQCAADFPLAEYPSPYLSRLLPVEPRRSTYVETVRGCRSHCTFCFYPRSSGVLRTLDVAQSAQLVSALRDRGAREVVFLDPTFNHRPQFEPLLDALIDVNRDRALTLFAEVRAEGLTPVHARKLKAAGFDRLELGLQTVNRETLQRVRRGGSAEKVAEAARMLHGEGIELLVDLIIGLPGDTPDDVLRGIEFLDRNGLAHEAQVFPLSLLPGTAMRATAADDGVVFDPAPPYRVRRTATFSEEQLVSTLFAAEDALCRRLDEWPRPHLCQAARIDGNAPQQPGPQHAALWFDGGDLRLEDVLRAVDERLRVDPYATLDVVLRTPRATQALVDAVRARFAAAPQSYLSRSLGHRGEDAQRRIAVVLPPGAPAPSFERAQIFREQSAAEAARDPERIGDDLPAALVVGPADEAQLDRLARHADADLVAFADEPLERAWQERVLGFGDAR